jgi:Holliday junction resolvase RusA-like endonuclease
MLQFEIPGEPKTKGRPRFSKSGHAYTPKETREAEIEVLLHWELAGAPRFTGWIGIECSFYLGSKRIKDTDNLLKLVLDALNKKAFDDDSQIVELFGRKSFVRSDMAKTIVRIWEINECRCSEQKKCEKCSPDCV